MSEGAVWVSHYMRLHSPGQFESESLEIAVSTLAWSQEDGWCSPGAIVCPDGRRIEGEELADMLWNYQFPDRPKATL